MLEGIDTLAEAFESAAAESDEIQSDEVEVEESPTKTEVVPPIVEDAEDEADDQPEVAETEDTEDDEMQSIVDDMLEGDDEEPEADAEGSESTEVTLETELTVDLGEGAETTTIQRLVDGNLRHADYTRKTQTLAAERADLKDAIDFLAAFNEDPVVFATALAVKANLIEEGTTPIKEIPAAKIQTQAEFEAAVDAAVEERLVSDPRMTQATEAAAVARTHAEFDRIQAENGVTISPELRSQIVDEAIRRGTADLELVFEARVSRAQASRARTAEKRRASPSRPTSSPASDPPEVDAKPEPLMALDAAFDEAFAEAV